MTKKMTIADLTNSINTLHETYTDKLNNNGSLEAVLREMADLQAKLKVLIDKKQELEKAVISDAEFDKINADYTQELNVLMVKGTTDGIAFMDAMKLVKTLQKPVKKVSTSGTSEGTGRSRTAPHKFDITLVDGTEKKNAMQWELIQALKPHMDVKKRMEADNTYNKILRETNDSNKAESEMILKTGVTFEERKEFRDTRQLVSNAFNKQPKGTEWTYEGVKAIKCNN